MNNLANETLAGLLQNPTDGKKAKAFSRAKSVVKGAPEVLVKISGFCKGGEHMGAHLDYISRKGDVDLETEKGEVLFTKEDIKALHKEWSGDKGKRNGKTRDTANIVLSMPIGTNEDDLKDSVRKFAKNRFGHNYQYVMACHDDSKSGNPHVHLTIKTLGFDGKRLHIKKGDPQKMRVEFAEQLRNLGIEAEATPRADRGIIKDSIKQVLLHIRNRGVISNVEKNKLRAIIKDIQDPNTNVNDNKPWEDKIFGKQTKIRRNWILSAKILSESSEPEDKVLGKNMFEYVKSMPLMRTDRQEMRDKFISNMSNIKDNQKEENER
jgi:hypothetical protein